MKIHVTGATGFVGSHFVTEARRRGHEVVALVRRRDEGLAEFDQIEIGDIADRIDWSEAVEGADVIVHLAARVHVMREHSEDLDRTYSSVNTQPTSRLARAAEAAGVRRFVFMSSIKVNGERTNGVPFSSDSTPAPMDPYGRSKFQAEIELAEITGSGRLSAAVLRPTVVYGAGVGGNIRRIGKAIRRGIPLPLGSVRNARTMLAVENLVEAILAAAEADFTGTRVFLLGDPEPISTRRLAEVLGDGIGVKARLLPFNTRMLTLGAAMLGRRSDAARLVEDLVVKADWSSLGIREADLTSTETGMTSFGSGLRGEVWH